MGWKEQALALYEESERLRQRKVDEDIAAKRGRLRDELAKNLKALLSVEVDPETVIIERSNYSDLPFVVIDGIEFSKGRAYMDDFVQFAGLGIVRRCPQCQAVSHSKQIKTLVDIGREINREAVACSMCPRETKIGAPCPSPETPSDRLIDNIKGLVREVLMEG